MAPPVEDVRLAELLGVLTLGTDLGKLPQQASLGDFVLPQRGIFFADGMASFKPRDLLPGQESNLRR